MPRAEPSAAVFREMRARHQNIRSPAPEPVQPYHSDCPCRRVGTLPKLCQIDACTVHDRRAQATPVPPTRRAMRLSGIDFAAPGRCREKTARERLRRFDHARTGDPARVAPMRGAALRACIIRGAARRSDPARALLIRLRFAADPSGWRPRYHPLRFARIIRYAPRRAARDTRTASITPVPARRLETADKA